MKRVAIIDYGMCNLDSVARAVEECGGTPFVTDQEPDIEESTHIILPGVGAFHEGMAHLRQRSLDKILHNQVVRKGIPLLGICLGMQMLATNGFEGGKSEGLGWINGEIIRLDPVQQQEKVPHIGWNEVIPVDHSPLFKGIESRQDFYFVHSYHFRCSREEDVLARTEYCGGFVSAIGRGSVFGVQFHPEKSQRVGFQVLRNFLSL